MLRFEAGEVEPARARRQLARQDQILLQLRQVRLAHEGVRELDLGQQVTVGGLLERRLAHRRARLLSLLLRRRRRLHNLLELLSQLARLLLGVCDVTRPCSRGSLDRLRGRL